LLVQTYAQGDEAMGAMLEAMSDFLATARARTQDLDSSLILMTVLAHSFRASDFGRLNDVGGLMRTPEESGLWIDEAALLQRTGVSRTSLRRKLDLLAAEGLLVRRDGRFAPHPDALADPRFGFDQAFRLVKARAD
jgi:hypothetical protein